MVRLRNQTPILVKLSSSLTRDQLNQLASTFLTSPFPSALPLSSSQLTLNKPGRYLIYVLNSSCELKLDIKTPQTKVLILAAYWGKKTEKYSFHLEEIFHYPSCRSLVRVVSILEGATKFFYQTTIQAKSKAKNISAQQENYNLILSPQAEVESQPFLEINNGQLKCSHSSVTTPTEENKLNYLLSRSLTSTKAKELLIRETLQTLESRFRDFFGDE